MNTNNQTWCEQQLNKTTDPCQLPEPEEKPKSMVNNTGQQSFIANLIIKVQKETGGDWVDVDVVVNNNYTFSEKTAFAFDITWNSLGGWVATEVGKFRVYAVVVNPNGLSPMTPLVMDDDNVLEGDYEFEVI